MTSPQNLKEGDVILVLHDPRDPTGVDYHAVQFLQEGPNVHQATLKEQPKYFGGYYNVRVSITMNNRPFSIERKLAIRRDLLITKIENS